MNKNFVLLLSASAVLLVLPAVVFGQFPLMPSLTAGVNLYVLIVAIATIVLEATWIIAITFVVIMFVIAGFKFFTAQGEPGKVAEARQAVIWGVAGVVVVILAWSILAVMRITLGI